MVSASSRIFIVAAGLMLAAVLVVPMWKIELVAPQYPEGLELVINPDGLAGNVDIINGLNHYIGMKTLHDEDFPEFKILPWIIVFFSLGFIVTGISGNKKALKVATALFITFGIVAMADFWRWEYQYGHDLDPNAAIQVPGMAYQPPLIGYKQLLNFAAYSMPATGGWLFICAGVIISGVLIYETRFRKSIVKIAAIMFIFSTATSCNEGAGQINYGSDNCDYCKMTLTDARFGIIFNSDKGRNYKFDDFHCLFGFRKDNPVIKGTTYVADYSLPNAIHPLKNLQLLESAAFKSPMGGNIAAFANKDSMVHYRELTGATMPTLPFPSE